MARAKRASDEAYNARRRAKRAAARAKKAGNTNLAKELGHKIAQSYVRKGQNAKKGKNATYSPGIKEELNRVVRQKDAATQRANKKFEEKLNRMQKYGTTLDNAMVAGFYSSTMPHWQGRDPMKRNETIMAYFGVATLEEAWNIVTEANNEHYQHLKKYMEGGYITTDEMAEDGLLDGEEELYEDYMMSIRMF